MVNPVYAAIEDISSGKVRQRQEGISALTQLLDNGIVDKWIKNDSSTSTRTSKLARIFNAIYDGAVAERTAFIGSGSSSKAASRAKAADGRLSAIALLLRNFTEKNMLLLVEERLIESHLSSLSKLLVYQGQLVAPAALAMLKAFDSLLSCPQVFSALDATRDKRWHSLLQVSLNILLGQPIDAELDAFDVEGDEGEDSEMDVHSDANSVGTSAKRRHASQRPGQHAKRAKLNVPLSQEQIACASLLKTLLSVSPNPLYDTKSNDDLTSVILGRFRQLLRMCSSDSSLHMDILSALLSVLPTLTLNHMSLIQDFAASCWSDLVSLWGTKTHFIKETLLAIFQYLLPYHTALTPDKWAHDVAKLCSCLRGAHDRNTKWDAQSLSLDALRLEVEEDVENLAPFQTHTFRAGHNFDSDQAITWVMLDLQAQCTRKLYSIRDSMAIASQSSFQTQRHRALDPIRLVLQAVDHKSSEFPLQSLLFIIIRCWHALEDDLQTEIAQSLLRHASRQDHLLNWVLLCLAAIVQSERCLPEGVSPSRSRLRIGWDQVWQNAICRISVPAVCRVACHLALIILTAATPSDSPTAAETSPRSPDVDLFSSHRITSDLENLTRNFSTQQPLYPYDSICLFLAKAIQWSSRDRRLYRLRLGDEVLTWLIDVSKAKPPSTCLNTTNDLLYLLALSCDLNKVDPHLTVCRYDLPDTLLIRATKTFEQGRSLRNFQVEAQLPLFRKPAVEVDGPMSASHIAPCERSPSQTRVSDFHREQLKALLEVLEIQSTGGMRWTNVESEHATRLALLALLFQTLLSYNGVQNDRLVCRDAAKLILGLGQLALKGDVEADRVAALMTGLESLVSTQEITAFERGQSLYVGLIHPGPSSGLKDNMLPNDVDELTSGPTVRMRKDFLSTLWQDKEVTEQLLPELEIPSGFPSQVNSETTSTHASILVFMRSMLHRLVNTNAGARATGMLEVEDDEFGETGTMLPTHVDGSAILAPACGVCIAYIASVPVFHSASGQATRDPELFAFMKGLLERDIQGFLSIVPYYIEQLYNGTLELIQDQIVQIIDAFRDLVLEAQDYSEDKQALVTAVHFLHSTMPAWLKFDSRYLAGIGAVYLDLEQMVMRTPVDWTVSNAFADFLRSFLHADPRQVVYDQFDLDNSHKTSPRVLLLNLLKDRDFRVRCRAARLSVHILSLATYLNKRVMTLYEHFVNSWARDQTLYEEILSRLLSQGNLMIFETFARRGAYWHVLELVIYSERYVKHANTVLLSVVRRLGMPSLSKLFDVYAPQVANAAAQQTAINLDFSSKIDPFLIGYPDRLSYLRASYQAFATTYISQDCLHGEAGQRLFTGHCRVLRKSIEEGISECFPEIVACAVPCWIYEHGLDGDGVERLSQVMVGLTRLDKEKFFNKLNENMPSVLFALLRLLTDDVDYAQSAHALTVMQEGAAEVFERLLGTQQRNASGDADLPAYSPEIISNSLWYFFSVCLGPNADTIAITYHVTRRLFFDILQAPFVNQQLRSVNALCFWVACNHKHFEDRVVLRALIQGATILLSQVELATSARSILDWAFEILQRAQARDEAIPSIILRMAYIAEDYALDSHPHRRSLGISISSWIDERLCALHDNPLFQSQVMRILPAWPRLSLPRLAELHAGLEPEAFVSFLQDTRIAANKFSVVQKLRDFAVGGQYDPADFGSTDFWLFREAIPSKAPLDDADIDAFVTLLSKTNGPIRTFHDGLLDSDQEQNPYWRRAGGRINVSLDSQKPYSPHADLIVRLFVMLESDVASRSQLAYNTLLLVITISHLAINDVRSLASDYQRELGHLQAYPATPIQRPAQSLAVLSSEAYVERADQFSDWVMSLADLLSGVLFAFDPFYGQLQDILRSDVDFAEQALPVFVHQLLIMTKTTSEQKDCDFHASLSNYFTAVLKRSTSSRESVRSVVEIILHLRKLCPDENDVLSFNKWLDIDFILLSRSAVSYGAYTTALLFLDMAWDTDPKFSTTLANDILYNIYSHIDEPDGFYSVQAVNLDESLKRRFAHERQWEHAFRFHGAAFENDPLNVNAIRSLATTFYSLGLDRMAMALLQSAPLNGSMTDFNSGATVDYALGWRTGIWDLPELPGNGDVDSSLYFALRAAHRERDRQSVGSAIQRALTHDISILRTMGSENLVGLRRMVRTLLSVGQIAHWHEKSSDGFTQINAKLDFQDIESIMATRLSLIRSAQVKEARHQIGDLRNSATQALVNIESACLLRLSEAARDAGEKQIALNSITRAMSLHRVPSFEMSFEYAQVLWMEDEAESAIQQLKMMLVPSQSSTPSVDNLEKAVVQAKLGTWLSLACAEQPKTIQELYFDQAVTTVGELASATAVSKHSSVYNQCAVFADHQYQALLSSEEYSRRQLYLLRKTQELENRRKHVLASNDPSYKAMARAQVEAQKTKDMDETILNDLRASREMFLVQALHMYSLTLATSDADDMESILRFSSLWMTNFDEVHVQEGIRPSLSRIPSSKFVFLSRQLCARISPNEDTIYSIVMRMCRDHPFHCLYQLFCLQQSQPSGNRRRSDRHAAPSIGPRERAQAAGKALDILENTQGPYGYRIKVIRKLCEVSLQVCMHQWIGEKGEEHPLQDDSGVLLTIKDRPVPPMTAHIPIDPTLRYNDLATIVRYEPTFKFLGGNSWPKLCTCIASDGSKYKQLFKGWHGDDVRQDAVMEQVFELVNRILSCDKVTRRRSLSFRTYIVVPLSTQAGVIEFVTNTVQMGEWLELAHTKYRPNDMSYVEAAVRLKKIQLLPNNSSTDARRKAFDVFMKIRTRFHPVMRYFFVEKHKDPLAWFSTRLNYTRSVATTSIVGHMVGLGDRHVRNILIDQRTGEVIQIDLGVAFDQGKLLPRPEMMPFRLTADMVDGMGYPGTTGVFQRCAEETLRVLRSGSELILTVLSVFRHDPLHTWVTRADPQKRGSTVDETEQDKRVWFPNPLGIDMDSRFEEEAADRALNSVTRKLDKTMSEAAVINTLIADATDVEMLANTYYGWSPHF